MRAGRYAAATPDLILTKQSESSGNVSNSLDRLRHPRSDAYLAAAALYFVIFTYRLSRLHVLLYIGKEFHVGPLITFVVLVLFFNLFIGMELVGAFRLLADVHAVTQGLVLF